MVQAANKLAAKLGPASVSVKSETGLDELAALLGKKLQAIVCPGRQRRSLAAFTTADAIRFS